MDEAARAIVRVRVARADEELNAARNLIDDGLFRIACSLAYYAAFLMTTAALLTVGVTRAKHAGVQAAFHELFIKGGHMEVEYGRLYTLLRATREASDYDDRAMPTEELARQRLADAERFVARLMQYLRQVEAIN